MIYMACVLLFGAVPGLTAESGAAGLLQQVSTCNYAPVLAEPPRDVGLITWNLERGSRFQDIREFLRAQRSDILALQEVDVNARRSGNRKIYEDLARDLGMNCVFAAEFEELGQRVSSSPALHGQAILTALAIRSPRILRFKHQSDFWHSHWYVPNLSVFQRRTGGRLALVAELESASSRIVLYDVHLESRGAERLRVEQIQDVLEDAATYPTGTAIVLAGDLNIARVSSPVIGSIERAGFRRAAGGEVTTTRGAPLDWIFTRGAIRADKPKVHRETPASDHYPLSITVQLNEKSR
jgi:endonuclease/exonuclease/phosphatase family metal-dependent hydrolase